MNTSSDYDDSHINIRVPVSPYHPNQQALDAVQALHDKLTEARAHFPTPPPRRLSPDSYDLGELNLAPSTTILVVERSSEGVEKGATPDSTGPGRDDEEEPLKPQGTGSERVRFDQCGAERGQDNCTFLASARQCRTQGTYCMDCNELVDNCTCPGLPTRPRHRLTIDSTIVLAAFDQANEVTCCFHQTHA